MHSKLLRFKDIKRKMLLSIKLSILASLYFYRCNADSRSSAYELIYDIGNTDEMDGFTSIAFNPTFHRCSLVNKCNFVVKNVETKKYSYEIDLPEDIKALKIWKKVQLPVSRHLTVKVTSSGSKDPGFNIDLPDAIQVDGKNLDTFGSGFRVVALSEKTGDVIAIKNFDTSNLFHGGQNTKMADFFDSLSNGTIVAISVVKGARQSFNDKGKAALHSIGGAVSRLYDYGSYALIAQKGVQKQSWFIEKVAMKSEGPIVIEAIIPY